GVAFAEWGRWLGRVFPRQRLVAPGAVAVVLGAAMLAEYSSAPALPILGRVRSHTFYATVDGFPAGIRVPLQALMVPKVTPFRYPVRDGGRFVAGGPLLEALRRGRGPVLELPVGPGDGGTPLLQ